MTAKLSIVVFLALHVAGCAGAGSGGAVRAPDDASSDGTWPAALANEAAPPGDQWVAARDADRPWAYARLAAVEGVAGLVAVAERGGSTWPTVAVRALPYARGMPEAGALDLLCREAVRQPPGPLGKEALVALHRVLLSPPRDVEPLDAETLSRCDRALRGLVEAQGITAAEHDRADSARRLLAEFARPAE